MSGLYNMLCGINPASAYVLSYLHLSNTEVSRFRDTCISEDGKLVTVYARIGGGNREHHANEWEALKGHPQYVRDYDDTFDNTYASIEFKVILPEHQKAFAEMAAHPAVGTVHPTQKFAEVMSKIQEHKPGTPTKDPVLANALTVGQAIADQLCGAKPGHVGSVDNEHGGVVIMSPNLNDKDKP